MITGGEASQLFEPVSLTSLSRRMCRVPNKELVDDFVHMILASNEDPLAEESGVRCTGSNNCGVRRGLPVEMCPSVHQIQECVTHPRAGWRSLEGRVLDFE